MLFSIVDVKKHVVDTASAAKRDCDARLRASVNEVVSLMIMVISGQFHVIVFVLRPSACYRF